MRRNGYVRIDVRDILEEVDDGDLLAELESRHIETDLPDGTDIVKDAYDELRRGRPAEALALLERVLFPKWKSRDSCRHKYDLFQKERQNAQ